MDSVNNNNSSVNNTASNTKVSPSQSTSLMDQITSTINSLMPSKSKTKSKSPSVNSPTVNRNSLTDPVVTETSPYNVSSAKLESSLKEDTPASSNPDDNKGFLSSLSELFQKTYFKILLLILILAFLGFNLFKYLANATDKTTDLLGEPIKNLLAFFGYTVGETSKKIIGTSAEGTKLGVDVTAGAAEDAIDLGERALGVKKRGDYSNKSTNYDSSDSESEPDLDKAIARPRKNPKQKSKNVPQPDDAGSKTQSSKASGKSGFCYIGEDRGFRSCIKVQDPNTCMSGEIVPTRDICINPTLRE